MRKAKKWFWSDTHLFHANVLKFTDDKGELIRGKRFKNVTEMNECLLDNWNTYCQPQDKGYWLGDVALGVPHQDEFTALMKKFQGSLAMYLGNHDHIHQPAYRRFRYIDLWSGGKFREHGFVCSHIPLRQDQMRDGEFNVHGHIHQNLVMQEEMWGAAPILTPDPHYINVCVEQTNYKPVELDEIIAVIESRR